jgi:hypothetical protein
MAGYWEKGRECKGWQDCEREGRRASCGLVGWLAGREG